MASNAVLTLLALIAQHLRPCAPVVFTKLVPRLLGLVDLPAVGPFQPLHPATRPDFDVVDLALVALSFLGKPGPASITLEQIHSRFESHLRQLAGYSLQSGLLLTPAVVPLEEENFIRYEA